MTEKKIVKIRCRRCGHVNLIPTDKVFQVLTPIKCEKCAEIIVQPKRLKEEK